MDVMLLIQEQNYDQLLLLFCCMKIKLKNLNFSLGTCILIFLIEIRTETIDLRGILIELQKHMFNQSIEKYIQSNQRNILLNGSKVKVMTVIQILKQRRLSKQIQIQITKKYKLTKNINIFLVQLKLSILVGKMKQKIFNKHCLKVKQKYQRQIDKDMQKINQNQNSQQNNNPQENNNPQKNSNSQENKKQQYLKQYQLQKNSINKYQFQNKPIKIGLLKINKQDLKYCKKYLIKQSFLTKLFIEFKRKYLQMTMDSLNYAIFNKNFIKHQSYNYSSQKQSSYKHSQYQQSSMKQLENYLCYQYFLYCIQKSTQYDLEYLKFQNLKIKKKSQLTRIYHNKIRHIETKQYDNVVGNQKIDEKFNQSQQINQSQYKNRSKQLKYCSKCFNPKCINPFSSSQQQSISQQSSSYISQQSLQQQQQWRPFSNILNVISHTRFTQLMILRLTGMQINNIQIIAYLNFCNIRIINLEDNRIVSTKPFGKTNLKFLKQIRTQNNSYCTAPSSRMKLMNTPNNDTWEYVLFTFCKKTRITDVRPFLKFQTKCGLFIRMYNIQDEEIQQLWKKSNGYVLKIMKQRENFTNNRDRYILNKIRQIK